MTLNFLVTLFILSTVLISYNVNAVIELDVDPPFDPQFYENLLDPELCQRQLRIIRNNTLLYYKFLDSGVRLPRSILSGNIVDLGNYYECLGINQLIDDTLIEGKYCTIKVPLEQDLKLPQLPEWPEFPNGTDWLEVPDGWSNISESIHSSMKYSRAIRPLELNHLAGIGNSDDDTHFGSRSSNISGLSSISLTLALCVPKACTTKEGLDGLLMNVTTIGLSYHDRSCRLPGDKPLVAADYVATTIFAIIILVTVLSTSYDIYFTVIMKRDSKSLSTLGKSFSLYTNTKRLTTFSKNPDALECLDGIRSIAMTWVIVGHTFYSLPAKQNNLEVIDWQTSFPSFWITSAPITVDTFFMLSGLLLVYTACGKMTGIKLLKNLHLFYLNRLLRMFPLLAAAVLLQASFFNRMSDGPMWESMAVQTNNCRSYWWITLLYVQNYVGPNALCLSHTWYLAVDMQLHILSPIVLYWVLSKNKRVSWSALSIALLISLTASTTYIFINELPGGIISTARLAEMGNFVFYYYFNTLTRAPPFFVGMVFGYVLHMWRGRRLRMKKMTALLLWFCALTLTTTAVYSSEPMKDIHYANQLVDSLVNSFARPLWAVGLGWIIIACVHGYGGPVNWLLSLRLWKLPSRISYAMYLFHFPIMFVIAGSALAPIYFTVMSSIIKFISYFAIAFLVGFVMTLVIDSPFSTICKLLLGGGGQKKEGKANGRTMQGPKENKDIVQVNPI